MKCLTLIIHQSARQDLVDHLRRSGVPGFTLSPAEGHSDETSHNPFETTRDRVLGFVPRYRVEVILEEDDLARILTYLRGCDSCVQGRGIWWVTRVEDHGRL